MPSLQSLYLTAPADHSGHAECVIATYPDEFKYTKTHEWLWYNGRFWETDQANMKLDIAIRDVLRKRAERAKQAGVSKLEGKSNADIWNMSGVRNVMKHWQGVYADINQFDNEPNMLNCQNGVLDLRTGKLVSHSPSDSFTYCIPANYDPKANQSVWLDFLASQDHHKNIVHFLQYFLGYCLTGLTTEEMLAYFFGPTRTGKGVLSETVLYLLGSLAQGVNFRIFTTDRQADTQNFDLAPLRNKRLLVAGEPNRKEGLNEATIKMLTGGDDIYCAFKRKDHFSYRPQFKAILTSNHKIAADPADTAVWGRLRLVPFNKSFLGSEDKSLKARLRESDNLAGVLAWMVEGAMGWYQYGMPNPKEMRDVLEEHRASASSVIAFVSDYCQFAAGEVEVVTFLYSSFRDYCKAEGHGLLGRKRFKEEMEVVYGMTEIRKMYQGRYQRVYEGVKYVP